MLIKRNIERIKNLIKEFGLFETIKIYIYYTFSRNNLYIKEISKFLIKDNFEILEKYKLEGNDILKVSSKLKFNKTFWFFWWQGYDNMPEIPRMCYKTLQKNIPKGYQIVFLDKNNYFEYANIPKFIIDKLNDKKISLTHFSDLLRQELLCSNGGIWIDSTVYCPNKLNETELKKEEFWSVKIPFYKINKKSYGQNISKGMYTGFLLKNTCHSVVMKFLKECNYNYWLKHDYLIDYFIQILIIKIGYENIDAIKREIDNYKENNTNLYELNKKMNKIFNDVEYKEMISNTNYFKLSWKEKYIKEIDGIETFYGHIVNKL